MTPGLRAFARALVDGHAAETADEIVQTVLIGALSESGERRGTRLRLFLLSSVLTVNRRALRDATLDQQAGARNRTAQQGGVSASQWDMPRVSTNRNAVLLDDMPLEWRETLLLVALEELTYIQTAECLGVTLNTVISNLSRAREQLGRKGLGSPASRSAAPARTVPYLRVIK